MRVRGSPPTVLWRRQTRPAHWRRPPGCAAWLRSPIDVRVHAESRGSLSAGRGQTQISLLAGQVPQVAERAGDAQPVPEFPIDCQGLPVQCQGSGIVALFDGHTSEVGQRNDHALPVAQFTPDRQGIHESCLSGGIVRLKRGQQARRTEHLCVFLRSTRISGFV